MERQPVADGGKKAKQGELTEAKLPGDRIFDEGNVKRIDPVVDVVEIQRQGVAEAVGLG